MRKNIVCSFIFLFFIGNIAALGRMSINPKVELNSIKMLKATEKHGDELYITVTSFPSKGRARHHRIPSHPLFWPGRNVSQLKNIRLWEGKLNQGKSVRLLISLIEEDSPPWNIDDEIGSVSLKLHNQDGKLQVEWDKPNQTISQSLVIREVEENITIEFTGHGQSYQVSLGIKT